MAQPGPKMAPASFGGTSRASPAKQTGKKTRRGDASGGQPAALLDINLELAHSFGVKGPIRNNVELIPITDDVGTSKDHVMFPSGQHVALMRVEDGEMRMLPNKMRPGCRRLIVAITMCPKRRHVAVIEQVTEDLSDGMTPGPSTTKKYTRCRCSEMCRRI